MSKYFWHKVGYFFKRKINPVYWIPATILCIRFPFLYPRNRFSGKHYTNWELHSLQEKAHEKAYKLVGEFGNKDNPAHVEKVSGWWAFVEKFYSVVEDFLGLFHIIPTYTELGALPSGWRKAFGINICKDLKRALLEDGGRKKLRSYRIDQIKEKFGELCWYDHGGNEETNRIIYKYTYISLHTCIVCGKSADYVTRGWIEPYCKKHLPDHINPDDPEQVHEYFTEDFKFYGVYRMSFNKKKEPKDNGTEEETTGGN